MTLDSQWPVQQAVYSALTGDSTLVSLVSTRIYDHVPENAAFPYVELGEGTAVPGDVDTKTEDGMDQTIMIHTLSRYRGAKEAKQIMSAITEVLHDASLSISGHSLVMCSFEFSELFMEGDGLTRHGIQRFRVVTQESA